MLKKHRNSVIVIFSLIAIIALYFSFNVRAADPFDPGETLDPNCGPTDSGCVVNISSSSGAQAAVEDTAADFISTTPPAGTIVFNDDADLTYIFNGSVWLVIQTGDLFECSDGVDNDSDTDIDFPNDTSCATASQDIEVVECSDGVDNDSNTFTDFPDDSFGCDSASDTDENSFLCSNGIDDDGDTFIDFPSDPGCGSSNNNIENPQCNDGIDNDFNSLTDFPDDPSCSSPSGNTEGVS